jgi:hypothetical protein
VILDLWWQMDRLVWFLCVIRLYLPKDFVKDAPLSLVIVSQASKLSQFGDDSEHLSNVDGGIIISLFSSGIVCL